MTGLFKEKLKIICVGEYDVEVEVQSSFFPFIIFISYNEKYPKEFFKDFSIFYAVFESKDSQDMRYEFMDIEVVE